MYRKDPFLEINIQSGLFALFAFVFAPISQFCKDNISSMTRVLGGHTGACARFKVRSSETRPSVPNEKTKTNEENEGARKS